MMDVVELYGRALDQASELVRGIPQDKLESPTPCTDWNVRTLLNHMVGGNWNSAAIAEGRPRRPGEAEDLVGNDPAEAFQKSAEAAKRAWQQPGRLDQTYEMPMGTLPGQAVLSVRLLETVTHGWDLAKATGQHAPFDDDVVQAAMDVAQKNLSGERPPGFPFGPAVDIGDEGPAIDRLAAFMGREP